VKGTIDVELRKQAEIAKIEEIKQVTTINVLDEGRPPVKKERPKRATNAAIAFLLTLLATGSYYGVREVYGNKIADMLGELRVKS
jgi:capsular polysaccharide biosynthesis protein